MMAWEWFPCQDSQLFHHEQMQLGRKYHSMTKIPDLDSYKNCHINVTIFMSCKSSIFLQNHRAAGTENIPSFISISRSMCDAFCDLNRPGIRAWSETCRTLPILLNLGSLTERSLTLRFALIRPLASPFGKEVRIRIKWEISISALGSYITLLLQCSLCSTIPVSLHYYIPCSRF